MKTNLPPPTRPLKPRAEHEKERLVEILEAMARYVKAGNRIPNEWREEAEELIRAADRRMDAIEEGGAS